MLFKYIRRVLFPKTITSSSPNDEEKARREDRKTTGDEKTWLLSGQNANKSTTIVSSGDRDKVYETIKVSQETSSFLERFVDGFVVVYWKLVAGLACYSIPLSLFNFACSVFLDNQAEVRLDFPVILISMVGSLVCLANAAKRYCSNHDLKIVIVRLEQLILCYRTFKQKQAEYNNSLTMDERGHIMAYLKAVAADGNTTKPCIESLQELKVGSFSSNNRPASGKRQTSFKKILKKTVKKVRRRIVTSNFSKPKETK